MRHAPCPLCVCACVYMCVPVPVCAGHVGVGAVHKVNHGFLFPMPSALCFVERPALYFPHQAIRCGRGWGVIMTHPTQGNHRAARSPFHSH